MLAGPRRPGRQRVPHPHNQSKSHPAGRTSPYWYETAHRVVTHRLTGPATTPGASALTAAELRLLPLLSTHLSFPEIAAELFLSPHTVKSQAS
jgi:DNA-binding NarL/FixJ family response regulator